MNLQQGFCIQKLLPIKVCAQKGWRLFSEVPVRVSDVLNFPGNTGNCLLELES